MTPICEITLFPVQLFDCVRCDLPATRFYFSFSDHSTIRSCDSHSSILLSPSWSPITFESYLVLHVLCS